MEKKQPSNNIFGLGEDEIKIFPYQEINEKKIKYSKIKKENNGTFSSAIEYLGFSGLIMKSMRMKICQEVIYDKNDDIYILYCSFSEKNPEFYQFFYNLDRNHISTIVKKYSLWFDRETKVNLNDIENIYLSPILPPKSFDDEPILKLYLPVINNQLACDIYDQYGKQTIKTLAIGKEIILILKLEKLLFKKTICKPIWEVLQIKVFNKLNEVSYLFDLEDDDDLEPIDDNLSSETLDYQHKSKVRVDKVNLRFSEKSHSKTRLEDGKIKKESSKK